jgi:glucokinase
VAGSRAVCRGAFRPETARRCSISVVRDTAKYIGMAVATFAAAIDPEIVIVSGSVAAADLMLDPVRQECSRRLPSEWMNDLRVEFSTLGADAVAIGAARLAMLTTADAA